MSSGVGSHALTISIGVKVIANGAQCIVTIFEGNRFSDDIVEVLAREGLKAAPETGFDEWTGPIVARPKPFTDGMPDTSVDILFRKIKRKESPAS
jgi:hypothetical protein